MMVSPTWIALTIFSLFNLLFSVFITSSTRGRIFASSALFKQMAFSTGLEDL
nr:MAG TPA: hypothetical protein [Caudoviricetes sp.]